MSGRVYFVGNPWPNGHAVASAAFAAHIDERQGVFLDLELQTERYLSEGEELTDADAHVDDDWTSKFVWSNYHRCTVSSTKWGHRGVRAGTVRDKFDPVELDGRTLRADARPTESDDERAFGIYLLGHDGIAKHRITFRARDGLWDIDWRAAIALEYSGSHEFRHEFSATLVGLPFEGIRLPRDSEVPARVLLERFVADPDGWTERVKQGASWFVRA
jgi:hypothetical protein